LEGNTGALLGLAGGLLALTLIGAITGLSAAIAVKKSGLPLLGEILLGALGAIGAGFLLPSLGVATARSFLGTVAAAVAVALVLVFLSRAFAVVLGSLHSALRRR
jgi:uncharacterized membrane protein YeaQ/YmgE (transglycosylase-associated protein family)